VSIQSAVTLWNRIRISGLLDHRGGHSLYNDTEEFRCGQFFLCEEAVVPGSDFEKQAATVADALHPSSSDGGFIENASFWKLREASLRNLFTITDYTGVDPEVITSPVNNFTTADFLTQPPVRYWTARLNVTF
jgi:hypothetical protein